jgi:hypothetical protein
MLLCAPRATLSVEFWVTYGPVSGLMSDPERDSGNRCVTFPCMNLEDSWHSGVTTHLYSITVAGAASEFD